MQQLELGAEEKSKKLERMSRTNKHTNSFVVSLCAYFAFFIFDGYNKNEDTLAIDLGLQPFPQRRQASGPLDLDKPILATETAIHMMGILIVSSSFCTISLFDLHAFSSTQVRGMQTLRVTASVGRAFSVHDEAIGGGFGVRWAAPAKHRQN